MKDKFERSILMLENWVERSRYLGYEPFDGLLSPIRSLTCYKKLPQRILIQLVRQSPVNLRPLLGIRPHEATKGRGYMAWGYLSRFAAGSDEQYREKAENCLRWLVENRSPGNPHYGWGNHFDFVSRKGALPMYEPTIVWSSLIGQVFLDAYEMFKEDSYLDVAQSICNWIMELPKEKTDSGVCLSYVAYEQSSIHNSNMLGAAMLARTGRLAGNTEFSELAREAMRYSCTRQLREGAWYYGEAENSRWIDNFHTGYNLDSLECYLENTGEDEFRPQLIKGLDYLKKTFIESDGRPKYYHNRTFPIDIQCAAQAITTLAKFGENDDESLNLAIKTATWTIDHMQHMRGYFIYRIYPWGRANIPMMHWGQATMYKGLAELLSRL